MESHYNDNINSLIDENKISFYLVLNYEQYKSKVNEKNPKLKNILKNLNVTLFPNSNSICKEIIRNNINKILNYKENISIVNKNIILLIFSFYYCYCEILKKKLVKYPDCTYDEYEIDKVTTDIIIIIIRHYKKIIDRTKFSEIVPQVKYILTLLSDYEKYDMDDNDIKTFYNLYERIRKLYDEGVFSYKEYFQNGIEYVFDHIYKVNDENFDEMNKYLKRLEIIFNILKKYFKDGNYDLGYIQFGEIDKPLFYEIMLKLIRILMQDKELWESKSGTKVGEKEVILNKGMIINNEMELLSIILRKHENWGLNEVHEYLDNDYYVVNLPVSEDAWGHSENTMIEPAKPKTMTPVTDDESDDESDGN